MFLFWIARSFLKKRASSVRNRILPFHFRLIRQHLQKFPVFLIQYDILHQIRPAFQRPVKRLIAPPPFYISMVAGKEHRQALPFLSRLPGGCTADTPADYPAKLSV